MYLYINLYTYILKKRYFNYVFKSYHYCLRLDNVQYCDLQPVENPEMMTNM